MSDRRYSDQDADIDLGGLVGAIWRRRLLVLGTRGHRLADAHWVDVDVPEIAQMRTQLLPERPRWLQIGTCLCSAAWVDAVSSRGARQLLVVIDESVLPLPGEALMTWLDAICERIGPGSELLISHDAAAPLRASIRSARPPQPSSWFVTRMAAVAWRAIRGSNGWTLRLVDLP